MNERTCSVCGYTGPATDFTVTRRVGERIEYNGRCRPCYNAYHKERRQLRGEEWHTVRRNRDFKKKYGITLDEYNAMLEGQNNCCAICGKHKDDHYRWLAVDHNHITGEVRGLLCDPCNKGIGHLGGDKGTGLLERAVLYINANGS